MLEWNQGQYWFEISYFDFAQWFDGKQSNIWQRNNCWQRLPLLVAKTKADVGIFSVLGCSGVISVGWRRHAEYFWHVIFAVCERARFSHYTDFFSGAANQFLSAPCRCKMPITVSQLTKRTYQVYYGLRQSCACWQGVLAPDQFPWLMLSVWNDANVFRQETM